MLICALSVLPIVLAPRSSSNWGAILIIGIAAAAHQGFSQPVHFAFRSVSQPSCSVIGLGGMSGAVGGMLVAKIVSYLLQWTGSHPIPFAIAGSAYLIGLAMVHVLSPRLERVSVGT